MTLTKEGKIEKIRNMMELSGSIRSRIRLSYGIVSLIWEPPTAGGCLDCLNVRLRKITSRYCQTNTRKVQAEYQYADY